MTTALYPGSFDPITNGHIDIATRSSKIFDKLYIGIFATPNKNLTFNIEERVQMATEALAHLKNVEVTSYTILTVKYAKSINAQVMVRGLRMVGDFEWEFEQAMMNKKLSPNLEQVCFMASQEYQFLSSRLIREVAGLGGDISCLVPKNVEQALKQKGLANQ
ncbi:MAG: pantetheine-phosphate adenylyltransferase [Dehalococcoidales bacterium]|nr:pantetheine-phosphate adenylyltransferase [Dehalococcoidales bacterium]